MTNPMTTPSDACPCSGTCGCKVPPKAATPPSDLREQIMNPDVPKNDREWWASHHIEKLEAALRPFASEAARWVEMGDTRPIRTDTDLTVAELRATEVMLPTPPTE